MTFREYYQELKKLERPKHPATVFVESIATKTGRSHKTIHQWLSGIQQPPKNICILIGEDLGIAPEELFPDKE